MATPRTRPSSRPDRRRPCRVPGRDPADGRDQRRLCRPDPRDGRPTGSQTGAPADMGTDGTAPPWGRPAATPTDPTRHRPGRYDRHLPAPQPDDAARGGRHLSASWLDVDRPAAAARTNGSASEPPRASTPTGPLERGRLRNFRRPRPPTPRPCARARRSSSASSTATRWGRSRLSSRRTSTGWPAR